MACHYADWNIPAEKEIACFNSFLAILNSGMSWLRSKIE